MVADALSIKSYAELAALMCREWHMLGDLAGVEVDTEEIASGAFLFNIFAEPTLVRKVIDAQLSDDKLRFILDEVLSEIGLEGWRVGSDQRL